MPDNPSARPIVMISSTALDLPLHRKEVLDACLRQSTIPKMQEYLPASSSDAESGAEAMRVALEMVDEAEIYLGIFANRYGYVPAGQDISITEMEYNRAVERGITRLIFLMHDEHAVRASDVETGEGAEKLKKLKERLKNENVVNFFRSPEDLRANVVNSLSQYREQHGKHSIKEFHYISDIPKPPKSYIAHPYTLLQIHNLVGRNKELNLLTDWVAKPDADVYNARIFNIVAIGGMGKSALTWKWFNDIAPQEMKPLAGRMWWSFYESDATFENFVIRALAYVTRRTREDIEENTGHGEREDKLLAILNQEPFLIVLDGLERILIAYARMDANRLTDDDLDEKTANSVAGEYGLPESAAQSFMGKHQLRKTADTRAGNFLRKLARVQASRILVSTRLYPADLQTVAGGVLPGSLAYFLRGLGDDDALNLWRAFGVLGSRNELLDLFHTFENHPLLIQALASEVAQYKSAPSDFDVWCRDNPDFDPFSLPLVQAKSHVLSFALRGLDEAAKKVLHTVAAFRMPAAYDTLSALLLGSDKIFTHQNALDIKLTELEDRGLLGWDKRANRYDLHPIVRGVAWSGLTEDTKQKTYETLHAHFASIPIQDDKIETLDDLTSARELYYALIGLKRYEEGFKLLDEKLLAPLMFLFGANRQFKEMLESLFPEGIQPPPRLEEKSHQGFVLMLLAMCCRSDGQLNRATELFHRSLEYTKDVGDIHYVRSLLAESVLLSGRLREAESFLRQALQTNFEESDVRFQAWRLRSFGLALATRGAVAEAVSVIKRAVGLSVADIEVEGMALLYLAQTTLWIGDNKSAVSLIMQAYKQSSIQVEKNYVQAKRLEGMIASRINQVKIAEKCLYEALNRARAINLVEEELPAFTGVAELLTHKGQLDAARELLENVWEPAERGPYPLFHADAWNVLAQIEREAGNTDLASKAATEAYKLSWRDGPPFAYHWGLEKARKHLRELGAEEPLMPPFDASKFEPMPEVEINPPDEFGGQES